jgi:glycosyltransferase involved in cell wall biosynthesis
LKILVVAQDFPWPAIYGSRMRLVQVLEVATSLGETDLFSLVPNPWGDAYMAPDDLGLRRVQVALKIIPRYTISQRARFVATRDLPIDVVVSLSREMQDEFRAWADSSYDVVWFSKAVTFDLLGRPRLGPTIVDLDDLEDRKITAQLLATRGDGHGGRPGGALMALGSRVQSGINAKRWSALQKTIAKSVDRVVLCSEMDADRFGESNTAIVVNGFDATDKPVGHLEVGSPPTMLFQGMLRYAPNSDAARWFVRDILPRVREQLPAAELRLVGDTDGWVAALHDPPSVTVVGKVPTMEPELAKADIVVVPLRYGSGTRLKILEAFSHRIPVVSTAIGAEGLGLVAGRHLLIADDPDGFASACAELLTNTDLRAELSEAAHREFVDKHHWGIARRQISDLLVSTAQSGHSSGSVLRTNAPSRTRQVAAIPTDRVGFLIVGTPRSGTTLLQRLACEINGIRTPPETHFFSDSAWDLVRRYEFPIGGPELRKEIERFASSENSKGFDIDVDELLKVVGDPCPSVYELFDGIVRSLAGPGKLWGEKTPGHLWWWEPIARAAPWMRFVVAVRDPRGVVASSMSMPWQTKLEPESWGDQLHLALATRWAFDQEVAGSLLDSLGPARCIVLRYEDVVSDPDAARLAIARLLGRENESGQQQAPASLMHPWEHWKQRAMGEVTGERIASWHSDLGDRRAAEVVEICRDGMERFGYPAPVAARGLRHSAVPKQIRLSLKEQMADYRHYLSLIEEIDLIPSQARYDREVEVF